MRLAIMQPYFFPYIGYYALINYVNHFIIFDTPQFIRHGWIERNRVLKPGDGWMYIKVPLQKHSRDTSINNILIRNTENWQNKILQQLVHYKKRAPYYKQVIDLLNDIFSTHFESIVDLNRHILLKTCSYIGIETPITVLSEMNLKYEKAEAPDEWALNISLAMNAGEYINPPNGKSIFDKEKYERKNIKLSFIEHQLAEYNQKRRGFEPSLSIIDVLMFNSAEDVTDMLNDNTFD
jgi:hypothetical protein